MARILTTPAGSSAAAASTGLLDRYTPKFPVGSVTVPPGVSSCFITGVAAGARAVAATGVNMPVSTLLGSSESGNIVIGTAPDAAATNPILYDPIGRKQVPIFSASGSPVAANTGGQQCHVSDDGFIFIGGTIGSYFSVDYGNTWQNTTFIKNGQRSMAVRPADEYTAMVDHRVAYISNTSQRIGIWNGFGLSEGAVNYANSTTLDKIDYVNGFFVASATGGINKTCFYYKDATVSILGGDGWPVVVVDAASNKTPAGMAYGNGIYVYACTDGSIYTATSITGPWTARTSNVASIHGIRFAGGRFVCVGNGVSTQTTDGITWTSGAQAGLSWTETGKVTYCTRVNKWVAIASGYTLYTSDNGSTWTQNPFSAPGMITLIANVPNGVLATVAGSGYGWIFPDPVYGAAAQFSTSNDGGALRVIRTSNNSEVLTLAGGLSNGFGGSTTGNPGVDVYGSNGVQPGTTSGVEARPVDMPHLGGVASYGYKVSGGAGRANNSQGGASLFAPATNFLLATSTSPVKPVGAGAGGAHSTPATIGGGGGEGVVRHKISVTPGEVLAYSAGLTIANTNLTTFSSHAFEPSRGYISFEFA
ncbi:hypothetical protein ACFQNF_05510 [Iodobacter arcticus]|uniref:Exo-alpha-sialidase n=1 Tax=Iodobacter arcticus TaxID=590593 RepID=A0ABW2QVA3_9NEIS